MPQFKEMKNKITCAHLIERVDERLETGKVSDKLEDPHDAHHPNQPHDLASLPHDLKVL